MSELRARCPSCGAGVKVTNPDLAGKRVKCPKCGTPVRLPESAEEPAEKEAPAASSLLVPLLGAGAVLAVALIAGGLYFAGVFGSPVAPTKSEKRVAARPEPTKEAAKEPVRKKGVPIEVDVETTPVEKKPEPPAAKAAPELSLRDVQPQAVTLPGWVTYSDPGKMFKMAFPAEPKLRGEDVVYHVEAQKAGEKFGVDYTDLEDDTVKSDFGHPDDVRKDEQSFARFAGLPPLELVSKQPLRLEGRYHGYEWVLHGKLDDKEATVRARGFLIGHRFFTLRAEMPKEDRKVSVAFLDSFRIRAPLGKEETAGEGETPAEMSVDRFIAAWPGREKLGKQPLTVTGRVKGFERTKQLTVMILDADDLRGVTCTMAEPQPWNRALPGQKVTVRGICADAQPEPGLKECNIVAAEGKPVESRPAAELAKEYEADNDAFGKKYDNRWLIVAGVVKSKKANDVGALHVVLETASKQSPVTCMFPVAADAEAIRPGAPARILGQFSPLVSGPEEGLGLIDCVPLADGRK